MSLKEKLIRLTEEHKKSGTDRRKERDFWTEQVYKLYDEIQSWFREYIDEGYVKPEFIKTLLYETGEYEIDIMELNLNGPVIVLEPMGCNFTGASGGIGLYLSSYKANKVMLLLMRDNNDRPYWELRKSRKDRMLFNKQVFENLLEDWLDNTPDL
ncbi:hypothetical protein QUF80_18130 [Desulfococcaceae bacterium HSG8]|nr:hypothetical protein [Desulfococcaceae bacterium HSG8]